jgi:hypothetical protein
MISAICKHCGWTFRAVKDSWNHKHECCSACDTRTLRRLIFKQEGV